MDEDDIPTLLETELTVHTNTKKPRVTVPLTIITGFLGAGKSTLIKRILTERHGYRIAVIMNEFGDTADIESRTINVSSPEKAPAETSEEFLELANGCLCCSIKDTGVAAIEKLMQRKGAFDRILLETTGLADPGPIASMFWQNEEFSEGLGREIHLDGVVCVVDAVFGLKQIDEDRAVDGVGESLRQLAGADVILLNKVDLVDPRKVSHLQTLIANVNAAATIYRTIRAEIDLRNILGIGAYGPERLLRERRSMLEPLSPRDSSHDDHHNCAEGCEVGEHAPHVGPHHYELRGISSLQIRCPMLSAEDLQKLDEWIRTALWENRLPEDDPETAAHHPAAMEQVLEHATNKFEILRCKGIFITSGGETYVLQGVRSLYEIALVEDGGNGRGSVGLPGEGKLVLIGKGLDQRVRRSLEAVLGLSGRPSTQGS